MHWRLPASLRSLAFTACRRYSLTAPIAREPLRILFCGSDEFSIASLRALAEAKCSVPDLIASIDVAHRPAKPTGRGLKTLKEVPIKHVATEELKLPTHVIDTFTGWIPPSSIDLIIAVSFGLFVPPRVLDLSRYGGINVHPSLLPDLRGPAPIEHAILKRRQYTGVSIQTLHPKQFDHGTIIAQSPAPGMKIPPNITSAILGKTLASAGAQMLVDVLQWHAFVPPHRSVGWFADSNSPIDHAPKITKQDRFVSFEENTMNEIVAMNHALGDLWCILPNGDRLIIHEIHNIDYIDMLGLKPGMSRQKGLSEPLFRAACGTNGRIVRSTYAGGRTGGGNPKALKVLPTLEEYPSDDWDYGKREK